MNRIICFIFSCALILMQGCSALIFQTRYALQPSQEIIPINDPWDRFAEYEYRTDKEHIRFQTIFYSSYGLVGIPVLPFFPIWMTGNTAYGFHNDEKLTFALRIVKENSVHDPRRLKPAIMVNGGRSAIEPVSSRCIQQGELGTIYHYMFNVELDTVETFTVQCKDSVSTVIIPTLVYGKKTFGHYTPLKVPVH